ncbi:SDR family oxidoreductase [Iamia sp. SCSIO 61187]|uniref:SDR family NAD(P)-dependent oxidoreductase n=1 Tax=Iamia sp. SCSIO 61187 TaxID=2722752 RepID=UPI001C6309A9|nr:SDR family oxidoreductase [Iamia sp. SCSIO 61187]QYG91243.1 SDR family oxidoreductase [Iamia sp. SCSIO 61187]
MTTPTVIVTGASAGFGRAVAQDLAAAGWDLVVDARTAADLDTAATDLRAAGATVTAITGDVADDAHRRALVAAAGPRLDLLVASAGTLGPHPLPRLADLRLPDLDRTLRTNVVAPVGLVQAALPALRTAGGVVVAVTSDAAAEAYEGWGAYGASKAALEQVAHVLGVEEPGLAVYRLDPGDMRTRMHQDAFPGEDISDRPAPEVVAPVVRHLAETRPPSGRYRAADLLGVPS